MRRACCLAALLAASACRTPPTELLVQVDTDFDVPAALDHVSVLAEGPSSDSRYQASGVLSTTGASLGLVLRGDRLGPVTITVTGLHGADTVVTRTVQTSFVARATRVLHVALLRACSGVVCAAGTTCGASGACGPVDVVDPATLPAYPDDGGPVDPSSCVDDASTPPFGPGHWPGPCWRPYDAASPFNQPLPAGAPAVANSAQIAAAIVAWGAPEPIVTGRSDTSLDWHPPTYYASATDPLFTVHCPSAGCGVDGTQLRIPDVARVSGGGQLMTVVDFARGTEFDFYEVLSKPDGGGTLSTQFGGQLPLDGLGLRTGTTSAHFGNLAGLLRLEELASGEIRHALAITVHCDSGNYVYPAYNANERPCSTFGMSNADAPAVGARLQLALTDAEIDALGLPPWKRAIVRAMAHYGMFVAAPGSSSIGLQVESGSTYTSFGRDDPWVAFARAQAGAGDGGTPSLDYASGINWARALRVIDPCVSDGSCP